MTRQLSYKLGRYKIIEGTSGGLWWESHYGLASVQTGRCFIEGNILILGPIEAETPGLLKREFIENLHKLPVWEKTKYFCSSHAIHKSKTGGRVSFPAEIEEHIDGCLNTVKSIVGENVKLYKYVNLWEFTAHYFISNECIFIFITYYISDDFIKTLMM